VLGTLKNIFEYKIFFGKKIYHAYTLNCRSTAA